MSLFFSQIIDGYAEFLYHVGLLDEKQKKHFQKQSDMCIKFIKEKMWPQAFEVSSGPWSNENQLRWILEVP